MAKYSTSQVQTYSQCPLKYRYRYVEKIPTAPFVETADTILGKIVHSSLEKLYNDISVYNVPTLSQVLAGYEQMRTQKETEIKSGGGEIVIRGDFTLENFKDRGRIYLQKYYDKHAPFADIQVIDTEMNFLFELEDGIYFQGIIDRLDKVGNSFIINDYKTGKKLPDEEKEGYIEQLTLYGIGIQQKYGKYFENMKARLYFLHFDLEDERELSSEKLNAVLEKYKSIIHDIEKKKALFDQGDKAIFQPQSGPLCRRCDYQEICPLFTAINIDDEVAGDISTETIKVLVDNFAKMKKEYAELEKQIDNLKEFFQKYVLEKDPNREKPVYMIQGETSQIKITPSPKFNVQDREKFLQKAKELGLFEKYADIAWQKVNSMFGEKGEANINDFSESVKKDTTWTIKSL